MDPREALHLLYIVFVKAAARLPLVFVCAGFGGIIVKKVGALRPNEYLDVSSSISCLSTAVLALRQTGIRYGRIAQGLYSTACPTLRVRIPFVTTINGLG